jgi:fibronectin-binding autotransporter adhesin
MRDNFTNTKQNFQYAKSEIDDLQAKAVLKSALTGTTLDNNMANNVIYNAQIRGFSGTVVAIAATSGSIAVDYTAGHYQTIVMAGNVSLSFTNFPAAGTAGMLRLRITVDAAGRTLTLPSAVSVGTVGVQGYAANVITFAAAGIFEFGFVTTDSGTTITLFDLNRPLNYYTNTVTIAATTSSVSSGSGALIVAGGVGVAGNLYVSGNIVGSIVATGNTFVGNTTVGNLLTSGFVTATGNVTGGNVITGGFVSATGNVTGGNLNAVSLSLSGNIVSAVNLTANVTTTANIAGGNVKTGGIMSATANVTGGNILTGGLISATSTITSTANITGANLLTGGLISATGVITSTANVTGGNILTGGLISAAGNVTGGNILGGANVNATTHTGATASLSGNITGGNILTAGLISAAGNVTGGNILTAGLISVTGNITGGNISAVIHTGTTASLSGNVTGGNVLSSALISAVGNAMILSGTAMPAGGTAGAGYKLSSTNNFGIFFGSGAPTLSAAQGSLYLRSDGSTTNDRMYVNTNGATTWTAVITAA